MRLAVAARTCSEILERGGRVKIPSDPQVSGKRVYDPGRRGERVGNSTVKPMRKMRVGTGTGGGRVGERSSPGRSLPSGVGRLRAGQRYQRALPKARFYPTLGFIVSNAGEAAGRLASLLNKIKFLSLCLSKWGEAQDNLRCASPPFTSDFSLFCESAQRRHAVRSVPPPAQRADCCAGGGMGKLRRRGKKG